MRRAVRAIIIKDDKLLVMHRNKYGSEYFTLVGGQVGDGESMEDALSRELYEETGYRLTYSQLVYIEEHPAPYNEQYTYLCEAETSGEVKVQDFSEEAYLNNLNANIHKPLWVSINSFDNIAFRTPQLQTAIVKALKKGFPDSPIKL